ncbi:MAG TPA: TMEM175 family protein [Chitinophagaceae bacterium]|jgi:TMEM175 potassium channel family protein|nr:TMEM175 family protein [Chitinophagaceae bacterium]
MKSVQSEIQLQKETLRIETFSDGVFCIAVTLLSIEIGVEVKDNITNKDLTHSLLIQWPMYLAYVISFVNVLLAWIGHHSLFKLLRKTNNSIMVANGLLLMLIALIPFPTKTLGTFLLTGGLKTAVVFYTGYFVLISLAFRLLWYAATQSREQLIQEITVSQIRQTTRNENIGLICNSLILCIALINPWIALTLSFAMWVYWFAFT